MQFDYHLVPSDGPFTEDDLAAMRDQLAQLTTYEWNEAYVTIFPNRQARDLRLPDLLKSPGEPDWLDGYARLGPDRVVLGILQDDDIRQQVYQFASTVVERRPDVRLVFNDQERPLTKLLPPPL